MQAIKGNSVLGSVWCDRKVRGDGGRASIGQRRILVFQGQYSSSKAKRIAGQRNGNRYFLGSGADIHAGRAHRIGEVAVRGVGHCPGEGQEHGHDQQHG